MLLQKKSKLNVVFRTLIYTPHVASMVGLSVVWLYIFNPQYGILNAALSAVGLRPLRWINDTSTAHMSIVIVTIWRTLGYCVVVYLGAIQNISEEIIEAAYTDGAGDLRVYWSIILPLSKSAIATVAIIGFIGNWNSYMWPKVVATKESLRTVQTGLRMLMQSDFGDDWGSIMAAATLITMPMILFFVCLQRYFVQGITKVGLK